MSLYGFGLENFTVWDRQQAGHRVAQGAPRELFGRLHHWRASRQQASGEPLLLIIGHSFGGLITFTALAQSLIEAAASQSGEIVPSYADLVLLVNPAFEGERYLPIHDLVKERDEGNFARNQRPVFVSVTAHNDWATGIFFPLGNFYRRFEESALGREEKQALIRTMGHIEWMRTHQLSIAHPPGGGPAKSSLRRIRFAETNPFWVVGATPEVVDGHNGIWQEPFVAFISDILSKHVQATHARRLKK
jgi:hypothetical protein